MIIRPARHSTRKTILAVLTAAALMVALPGTSFAASSARERDLIPVNPYDAEKVATIAEYWSIGNCEAEPGARVEVSQIGNTLSVTVDLTVESFLDSRVWTNTILLRSAGGGVLVRTGELKQTIKNSWQLYHTRLGWSTTFDPALFPYLHDVRWLADCS